MKLTMILVCAIMIQVHAASHAQISINEKHTTLEKIFKEIKAQADYDFFYNTALIKKIKFISINVKNASVEEVLDKSLDGRLFSYKIIDKSIVISERKEWTDISALNFVNTRSRINGKVTNETGAAFAGVNVFNKNTKQGTVTSSDGTFLIIAAKGDVLSFSFIGYSTKQATVGTETSLSIAMEPLVSDLSQVVVNGYGTQSRSLSTGAVGQVKSVDLENKDYTSLDQTLQGRVTGLQSVGFSGQPGALQQVIIRGIGSITANASPLYVVDGIVISTGDLSRFQTTANALAGINPNDIETINVLKDASATAIYGSRAANGVIIITTKQGKAGKTKVNFDIEYGITKPGNVPEAGRPLITDEWRKLTAQGLLNNPKEVAANGLTSSNVLAYVDVNLGSGNGVNTNWLDVARQTGVQEQYNLAIGGGNEKTQFHLSGGYFKQKGTVLSSAFKRYSTNLDLKTEVTERFALGVTLLLGLSDQDTPANSGAYSNPISAAFALLPFLSARNADGSPNIDPSTFPASNFNPLGVADEINNLIGLKGLGAAYGEYKILDNLKFTSRVGIDYNNLEENNYWGPSYGDGQGFGGLSSRYYTRYFNWVWTNLMNYHLDFNDHTWVANIKAGYEAQKSQFYFSDVITTGFPANSNITTPSNGSSPLEASGSNENYTIASMLSLADISYKGKYVLSGSFRRDGSSRFGTERRYGNFWSVGASWNVQEEDFLKAQEWISILKLRGSYGLTGNAGIGNYVSRQLYSYGADPNTGVSFNYNGMGGSAPTSVGNDNLTWETNKQLDVGLDLSAFKNRLSFTIDYYSRVADNLLLNQPTSLTTGFSSFTNNAGSMQNKGIELSISGTPVISGDFKWHVGFNIARNNNKILSLINGKDIVDRFFVRRVGLDFQTFYLAQWAGVDKANGSPLWYTDATRTATTSDYNAAALVASKSASPKAFGGFTSNLSYKGISLDVLMYYNFGNYVQDRFGSYTMSDGASTSLNRNASQLNAWQKNGDETNTPIYIYNNSNNSNANSSRYLYKGDYVRLRELTATYQFPKELLRKTNLSSLKVYVRGTNLLTWVKDKNLPFDPEAGLSSQGNMNITIPKVFTMGINVGF